MNIQKLPLPLEWLANKIGISNTSDSKIKRFARTAVEYENIVSQETIDEVISRLLSEGREQQAQEVKRANETLIKISSGGSALTRQDLIALTTGDFKTLSDNIKLGAGFRDAYYDASPLLVWSKIEKLKPQILEGTRQTSTRHDLDNPTILRAQDIDFSGTKSFPVIATATKFILPVPHFESGGEPLVYPAGHSKAGQPIVDYDGKPMGDKGVVFGNRKESVDAALGDGTAVMIINNVTLAQAEKLKSRIAQIVSDPEQLNLQQFKSVLTYARDELGLTDIYNSSREFVGANMSSIGSGYKNCYGPYKRDARDIVQAIYVVGDVKFYGTSHAAGGEQTFREGALIVKNSKGEIWGISKRASQLTYMLPDGQSLEDMIDVAELQVTSAQNSDHFGLKSGQIPIIAADGSTVGIPLSAHVIAAEGYEEGNRQPIQGTSTDNNFMLGVKSLKPIPKKRLAFVPSGP